MRYHCPGSMPELSSEVVELCNQSAVDFPSSTTGESVLLGSCFEACRSRSTRACRQRSALARWTDRPVPIRRGPAGAIHWRLLRHWFQIAQNAPSRSGQIDRQRARSSSNTVARQLHPYRGSLPVRHLLQTNPRPENPTVFRETWNPQVFD